MSETIVEHGPAAPKNAELDLAAYATAAEALTRMVRAGGAARRMPAPPPAAGGGPVQARRADPGH